MIPEKITVIGAGSWGTALAKLLGDKGKKVTLWGHRQEQINKIIHYQENKLYLPGFKLSNITITANLNEAVFGSYLVVMVVPSHVFREVFKLITPLLKSDTYLLSAAKGIETRL